MSIIYLFPLIVEAPGFCLIMSNDKMESRVNLLYIRAYRINDKRFELDFYYCLSIVSSFWLVQRLT